MSDTANNLHFGQGEKPAIILGKFANRHGLITGATGTGKTVTLQVLAENFSQMGVPVFVTDIKGDVSGLSQAGKQKEFLDNRAKELNIENYRYEGSSTIFWDIFKKHGHPVRTTIQEIGPLYLSRLLELSDVQEGVIAVAFKYAETNHLPLLDLKDLTSLLKYMGENYKAISSEYGRITNASIGAIQRRLLNLESQDAEKLFGEPALELVDLMRQDMQGNGIISIMESRDLMMKPQLYATFLLWLMTELFETLPEVGDLPEPKLVLFFDEAHLIFTDAPKEVIRRIEQVARLIRSKGVGIYFCTQSPGDIPENILGQLGNKVQHALRSYTPKDKKVIKAVADSFRPNPKLDTAEVITELGVGEALVSTLEAKGAPSIVDRVKIAPPRCRMGPATTEERATIMKRSPVGAKYDTDLDRESAHEKLQKRAAELAELKAKEQAKLEQAKKEAAKQAQEEKQNSRYRSKKTSSRGRRSDTVLESMGKSLGRKFTTKAVNAVWKALFGRKR
ncbi:helicase HerA-like domain-containing protein [Marinicella rhabdoformis]|uniref:helicase HerA-like domain-containing protein n=1 Tax=Marinicella rhabdoformis TaxID=2580566 RepID=UPI0012AEBD01|nr:helicase HerA-like domain-containing protein [Marinicella rhabdoformis]